VVCGEREPSPEGHSLPLGDPARRPTRFLDRAELGAGPRELRVREVLDREGIPANFSSTSNPVRLETPGPKLRSTPRTHLDKASFPTHGNGPSGREMGIRVSAMPSAVTRRRGLSGGEGVRHPLLT